MAKGPLGFPRLTSLGPLVNSSGRAGYSQPSDDADTRDEFVGSCKNSDWAEHWARGMIEATGQDPDKVSDERLEAMKEKACQGLADDYGY